MAHAFGMGIGLAAFWLLMSGYYIALVMILGLASVVLVVWIALRMELVDHESVPLQLKFGIISYWGWLGKEIFWANIDVAKIVLAREIRISPRMIRIPAGQKTDLGRVIFANSITLTPGTVSIDFEGDEILVHAITQEMADGLSDGDMGDRVTAIEGGG